MGRESLAELHPGIPATPPAAQSRWQRRKPSKQGAKMPGTHSTRRCDRGSGGGTQYQQRARFNCSEKFVRPVKGTLSDTGRRVMPALRAHHPGTLLRLADIQHPLTAIPVAQTLPRALVLALPAGKANKIQLLLPGQALDRCDKGSRHWRHQRRRRNRITAQLPEVMRHARAALQNRHVGIHIQAVHAFQLKGDVAPQHLRCASCYRHRQDSGRWVPHMAILWPPTPNGDHERGSVRRAEQRSESAKKGSNMHRRSEAAPR